MTINTTHRGMELTPAISSYLEEKMEGLSKYLDSIRHMDVEVGMTSHHHQKGDVFFCKAVVQIGGEVIKMERDADDLYKAIDKVRDHLRVELTEWKRKQEERGTSSSE